jgi:hypothetical protein
MTQWFIDLVSPWSSEIGWLAFFLSLIPVLLAHRALAKQQKPATKRGRLWRRCEFLLLWCIPLLGFIAAKASEWASGRLEGSHKIEVAAQSNQLRLAQTALVAASNRLAKIEAHDRPIEISDDQEKFLRAAFSTIPKGKIEMVTDSSDRNAVASMERLFDLFKSAGFAIHVTVPIGPFRITQTGRPTKPEGLIFQVWDGMITNAPQHAVSIIKAFDDLEFNLVSQPNTGLGKDVLKLIVGGPPYRANTNGVDKPTN